MVHSNIALSELLLYSIHAPCMAFSTTRSEEGETEAQGHGYGQSGAEPDLGALALGPCAPISQICSTDLPSARPSHQLDLVLGARDPTWIFMEREWGGRGTGGRIGWAADPSP